MSPRFLRAATIALQCRRLNKPTPVSAIADLTPEERGELTPYVDRLIQEEHAAGVAAEEEHEQRVNQRRRETHELGAELYRRASNERNSS